MTEQLHEILHLIVEIEKEDELQQQSHNRKKKLFDRLGELFNEAVNEP